jgi:hypothetical protein
MTQCEVQQAAEGEEKYQIWAQIYSAIFHSILFIFFSMSQEKRAELNASALLYRRQLCSTLVQKNMKTKLSYNYLAVNEIIQDYCSRSKCPSSMHMTMKKILR